jgi:hypothetical protein
MAARSVFAALEPLLPQVGKPIQYVGGELNSRVKEWDSVAVRWALMYPDAYEVGLPNQGVQILYEVINERADALAERTYSVWPDLEALMRAHRIPQFTVDAHHPVGDFDVLGVSFATELGYTNLLTGLDLAGIPLLAADRNESHPIVVAGGHAAFNPEPIADFVDAAVLGDGEQRDRGGRKPRRLRAEGDAEQQQHHAVGEPDHRVGVLLGVGGRPTAQHRSVVEPTHPEREIAQHEQDCDAGCDDAIGRRADVAGPRLAGRGRLLSDAARGA